MNDFKSLTSAELLTVILQGNEQGDEAMYFVLRERAGERLKEKYRTHEHVFFEEFDDIMDDFFLYLTRIADSGWSKMLKLRPGIVF